MLLILLSLNQDRPIPILGTLSGIDSTKLKFTVPLYNRLIKKLMIPSLERLETNVPKIVKYYSRGEARLR